MKIVLAGGTGALGRRIAADLTARGDDICLGAWVLRTDPELALIGRRCVPGRLTAAGYTFAHADLHPALADCLSS